MVKRLNLRYNLGVALRVRKSQWKELQNNKIAVAAKASNVSRNVRILNFTDSVFLIILISV